MLEAYIAALIGTCLAQAAPGPNLMAVAGAALAQGRRTALFVAGGVATGVLVWAAGVAYGLGAILEAMPVALTLLKIAGGSYLLWLAGKGLCAAWRGSPASVRAGGRPLTDAGAWQRGLLVVVTNPKAALMWTAVATFLFGAGLTREEVLAFGPLAALTAVGIYGGYGLVFSTGVATRTYARFTRWIEAAFGAVFGLLGGMLVIAGLRELRQ